MNCCIIKRKGNSAALHGSPACCISAELSFEWLQKETSRCSNFYSSDKPQGSGSSRKQFKGRKVYRRMLLFLHRRLQRGLTSAPQRAWGCLGTLVPENSELLPGRHRSSLKSGCEAARGSRVLPEGETQSLREHSHTQGPSVQL